MVFIDDIWNRANVRDSRVFVETIRNKLSHPVEFVVDKALEGFDLIPILPHKF